MRFTLAICLLAGSAAWAQDVTPLNVKTGEWEFTMNTQISGLDVPKQMPSISEEQLSKLPPAQRAQVEAAMKQYGALASGKPSTFTNKSCVKKEDLAKLNPRNNEDKSCKMTVLSSSRTKQEMKMDCNDNGQKQSGTLTIEAVNSESIRISMQGNSTDKGKEFGMKMNGTGKFLSSTCTEDK